MDSRLSAILPIEFTDATLQLQRIRFRLKTTPFRTNVTTSTSGSSHNHKIGSDVGPAAAFTARRTLFFKADGTTTHAFMLDAAASPHDDIWTAKEALHFHDPNFGIADDSVSPKEVTVLVNGVDKTTELFGFTPLAPAGANLDVVADAGELTNLILNAAGGLRQEHTIEIKCDDQQGRVEATVEIFEVNQSVRIV